MKAKRINDNVVPENLGEYSKFTPSGKKPYWMIMPPEKNFEPIILPDDQVFESHFKINVHGLIFIPGNSYHMDFRGYLKNGEWKKCLRSY